MENHEFLTTSVCLGFALSILLVKGLKKVVNERRAIGNVASAPSIHDIAPVTKDITFADLMDGYVLHDSEIMSYKISSMADILDEIDVSREKTSRLFSVTHVDNSKTNAIVESLKNIEETFNVKKLQKNLAN